MLAKWRTRRATRAASSVADSVTVPVAVTISKDPPAASPHADLWATDEIDIGITNVVVPPPGATEGVLFEISSRFPQAGRLWRVQRSVPDFAALHAAVETRCAAALFERNIHLPRASRLSWGELRAKSCAPSDDPAAQQMLLKLNAYLRKLLEIQEVVDDALFREFITPRPTSPGDAEVRAAMLPTLAIQPTTSVVSELHTMKLLASLTTHQLPESTAPVDSQCAHAIRFGSGIQLRALGGLRVGLTKRSGLSGSQKAVAVAAGVAGIALTGPLSAALALGALGGGVGKYQMNKSFYLTVNKAKNTGKTGFMNAVAQSASAGKNSNGCFVVENADLVSGPRRPLKFGDLFHLYCRNVRKSVRIATPPDSKHGHLMVTNAESKRATLRLVSPYGSRGGAVVCGSHVYLQVLNGQWAGQYLSLQGDFLATGNSPTVFKICQHEHACLASEETIAIVPRALAPRRPFKLRVMVYNVWLFPSILTSVNDKLCPSAMQRAQAIPKCVAPLGVDVVVFCEAFCSTAREVLVKGMKEHGFLFETKVVGEGASMSNKKAIDGGCFAMSRFPLEHFEELTFGAAAVGDDRMADKGVIYFQVRVPDQGETVHVFGTHLQAWETKNAVAARQTQLRTLREFMDSKKISPQDAVLVAGDLNVDACAVSSTREYETMLEQLQASDPPLKETSSKFSFDPLTNKLAVGGLSSGGRTERLDYVLAARSHRMPTQSEAQIVPLKATKQWGRPTGAAGEELVDLSDHYPVVCELQY